MLSMKNKSGSVRTFEQDQCLMDSLHITFLSAVTGEITDPVNIFNMFLTYCDLSEFGQHAGLCGGGFTGTPVNLRLTKEQLKRLYYYCDVFEALRDDKVTLCPPLEA